MDGSSLGDDILLESSLSRSRLLFIRSAFNDTGIIRRLLSVGNPVVPGDICLYYTGITKSLPHVEDPVAREGICENYTGIAK